MSTKNEVRQSRFQRFISKEAKDLFSLDLYRASAAEFLGLILLAFMAVGTGYSNPGSGIAPALEGGFYVGCAIRCLSTVSGGHVNPAISIGFAVLGQITLVRFVFYTIMQTLGAAAGTVLLKALIPAQAQNTTANLGVILPATGVTDTQAMVCEIIITFFLLFGTFAMIDPNRDDINGFAPFQIGIIVAINIFATINLSGGCMNPARTFGPAMVAGNMDRMWIYWVGDLIGAVAGALLYDKIFSTKVCKHFLKTDCRRCNQDRDDSSIVGKKYENSVDSSNEML